MYVGLYDQDLMTKGAQVLPSLEIMLLSGYYKRNGIAEQLYSLDKIEKFDEVYVNRGDTKLSSIKRELLYNPDIHWVGSGLTGKFIPLEPQFYLSIPDRSFYTHYFQLYKINYSLSKYSKCHKVLDINNKLFRLSNDGQLLNPLDSISLGANINIFYDENLLRVKEIDEVIEKLKGHNCQFATGQVTNDLRIFSKMRDCNFKNFTKENFTCGYNGPITKKDFLLHRDDFDDAYVLGVEKYNGCGPAWAFYKKQLIQKANFFYYQRARGRNLKLLASNDLKCRDSMRAVVDAFCLFTRRTGLQTNTNFLTFARSRNKMVVETVDALIEDPEIRNMFNVKLCDIYKSGAWTL